MAWNPNFQYQPTQASEYLTYDNRYIFGLPLTIGGTSNQCGAMPFRGGAAEISNSQNAEKVLRGEDWEWLYSFAMSRTFAPGWHLWGYTNEGGGHTEPPIVSEAEYPNIFRWPNMDQKNNMFSCIKAMDPYYFNKFDLEDQVIKRGDYIYPADYGPVIVSGITEQHDPIVSTQPTNKLSITEMRNFFLDCGKMKRTLVDVSAQYTSSRAIIFQQLNAFNDNPGEDPMSPPYRTQVQWYGDFGGFSINSFSIPWDCRTTCFSQMYAIVRCSLYDYGNHETKWVVIKVHNEEELATSTEVRGHYVPSPITESVKQGLKGRICNLLGWSPSSSWPRPNPDTLGEGMIELEVYWLFSNAQLTYLQPTWSSGWGQVSVSNT